MCHRVAIQNLLVDRPTPVLVNDLVDLGHETNGFVEGHNDALVVGDVVLGEGAALPGLEPLFADLVSADVEVPDGFGHAFEALSRVDPDGVVFPGGLFGDGVVACADESGNEIVDFGGFEQVQRDEFTAKFSQGAEQLQAGGDWYAGEVYFQKLRVAGAVGWIVKNAINVIEDVLGRETLNKRRVRLLIKAKLFRKSLQKSRA